MAYSVKEIFYTLQGEGAQAGRPAVFCRFTGCNLWNGLERDRAKSVCQFCDTDFIGTNGKNGGKYSADSLADFIASLWPNPLGGTPANTNRTTQAPYVVCTGGEPLLQLDAALIDALHARGFEIAVETNGTQPVPAGIDWVCVSPKAGAKVVVTAGDELKLVYPQTENNPADFEALDFSYFYLQPKDAGFIAGQAEDALKAANQQNLEAATNYVLAHPKWRLSLQTHKIIGIE